MKYISGFIIILLFLSCASSEDFTESKVLFSTTDTSLQRIYDKAEDLALLNIVDYGERQVLIEGAQYRNVWLETQPMGGYMYAKRNPEIARNNIEIFMDYQRKDGRLPGVIYNRDGKLNPNYCQFQGLYLAMPAYETYFLLGKDTSFLFKVYSSLAGFDEYLWRTRDSDNNGCLETWCIYDNGEDHSVRFNGFPNAWSYDYPPSKEKALKLSAEELKVECKEDSYDSAIEMTVPIESMDMMSYSYSCRHVLSLIAEELQNGQTEYWNRKAKEVQNKLKSYLWDSEKSACYDKDKYNVTMPYLLHNNLRCMYFGIFDQEMADQFVMNHLLNPDEFWTPMPLPSIAQNDPGFKNIEGNNWSGQPQGLTFQRSIRALENYGYYNELTQIGQKFLNAISDSLRFTQQFDPYTGQINNSKDGYGPSILTALEFISRMHGIHITQDKILWSCLDTDHDYEYCQKWKDSVFRLKTSGEMVYCSIDKKSVLSFSKGARVITDLEGKLLEVVGISGKRKRISIRSTKEFSINISPNLVSRIN